MALMTEQELDKIWGALQADTTNRSKGSFKRALWYSVNTLPGRCLYLVPAVFLKSGPLLAK